MSAGARTERACAVLGITVRTLQRWQRLGAGDDLRTGPKSRPLHALSAEERDAIVAIATSPMYRNLSVRQVVPLLADRNIYVASESSFYRVLHERDLMAHRSSARPATNSRPRTHVATGPRQVWSWDITYLRSTRRGAFYYLYLVLDVWSRKIVGWRVYEDESMDLAAALARDCCKAEHVKPGTLVLHSDNGGPMKGMTMLATLQRLGIAPSFSRPRCSDDNAICEALFRTMKYRPGYPRRPFASLEEARAWVETFVRWYNHEHLHSAIKYVTPNDRHEGRDVDILEHRKAVYREAKSRTPRRWTGNVRDWNRIEHVTLNPHAVRAA